MIRALDITGSGLVAQRTRLDVIAGNIANALCTVQEDGTVEPYRRRCVTFAPGQATGEGPGVHVSEIWEDPSDFQYRWNPGNPYALKEGRWKGHVQYPNVNITMEYVDAMEASRAYEANVAVMNVTKTMARQAIQLFA